MNEIDRTVIANVNANGWHVMLVLPSGNDPAGFVQFSYSVGLWEKYAHPKLILIGGGLQPRTMLGLVAQTSANVKHGRRYSAGGSYDDIMPQFDMQIGSVSAENRKAFLTYADWFNNRKPFEALQLVWPDTAGRFPGQAGYDERRFPQPLLAGAALSWAQPIEKVLHAELGPVRREASRPPRALPAPNDAGRQP